MRCAMCAAMLGLVGCASAGGNEGQAAVRNAGPAPVAVGAGVAAKGSFGVYAQGMDPIYTAPDFGVATTVPSTVEKTYTNVLLGYVGIGVPVMKSDPKTHVV